MPNLIRFNPSKCSNDYYPLEESDFCANILLKLCQREIIMENEFQLIANIVLLLMIIYSIIYIRTYKQFTLLSTNQRTSSKTKLALLLISGICLRIFLAFFYTGHPTDMTCWSGWALGMANYGPGSFYESMQFADYPPGYLLILWPIGILLRLTELPYTHILHSMLLKLPIIIFDLLTTLLIYYYAEKGQHKNPLLLAAFFFFNPAVLLTSSIWGQVDIVFSFFVILMLISLYNERLLYASIAFVLGLLIKPQMFLFGPIFVIGYYYYCKEKPAQTVIKQTLISGLIALGVFILICLPFLITKKDPLWLFKLYFSTMGSYPYGSLNATNFIAIINGLWAPDTATFLGLSYKLIGLIGILFSIGYTAFLAIKDSTKNNLALYGALMIIGIFTLGHHMHERYIFPALVCLILAYLYRPHKNTLHFFVYFSILETLNMSLVLTDSYLFSYQLMPLILSYLQVIGYILLCIYSYQACKLSKEAI
ncbi:uncharacterized membrane protein [Cellulosilyticum lentocellum DSM 5427]|uniref:Uncharacterized membrane protein n=2 Tax=Cellulosilyticum lentocellum TaxID=29360 RepID=F2JP54_CELLD|nr:uncharacterized membrane protein [Cellulosilyticum lentocellum DSM 5427]